MTNIPISQNCSHVLFERIKDKQDEIQDWLTSLEGANELPLYSSVDIRDAGFKVAVVDTNLFPAGFNNLSEDGFNTAVQHIKTAINQRVSNGKNILIIAEEHTRNTWYLENVRIIQQIIEQAGYTSKIATFLTFQPEFCEETHSIELETATKEKVRIYCFQTVLNNIKEGQEKFDLVIMNNDMTTGLPEILYETEAPIYPSLKAGWHSRLKSHHFNITQDLMNELSEMIDTDPWLFTCLHSMIGGVDINEDNDRNQIAEEAEKLFKQIENKYKEHDIKEKPYIFLKSDSGTYGMGVLPIEHPDDIIKLNRKNKNKLYKGKSAQIVTRYLLQEGVPSIQTVGDAVSEICMYQVDNNFVGGFYRTHGSKNPRENLNSQGAQFKSMNPKLQDTNPCAELRAMSTFQVYRILARIAGIAAHREIVQLESQSV